MHTPVTSLTLGASLVMRGLIAGSLCCRRALSQTRRPPLPKTHGTPSIGAMLPLFLPSELALRLPPYARAAPAGISPSGGAGTCVELAAGGGLTFQVKRGAALQPFAGATALAFSLRSGRPPPAPAAREVRGCAPRGFERSPLAGCVRARGTAVAESAEVTKPCMPWEVRWTGSWQLAGTLVGGSGPRPHPKPCGRWRAHSVA